jgi:hypothetical protein
MPELQQLRRILEIMGTYYCKSEKFGEELFYRFSKLGKSLEPPILDEEIQRYYEVAISFSNKADVVAFGTGKVGLNCDILRLFRFVDEVEPTPANRNDATLTDFDRANVGAPWFARNIAVVGLIKNMVIQLKDERVPNLLRDTIRNYLAPYLKDIKTYTVEVDIAKLDKAFGPGTYAAFNEVEPLEIFRGLPKAKLNGESPNNYIIANKYGEPVTKLEANFRATKASIEKLKTLQVITGTEMLIGALLESEGEGRSNIPTAELKIQPLELNGQAHANGLDIGVIERLEAPETPVDVFDEQRPTGHPNDKIAASLLKRLGHEKMAELSSLQIKIVMGARSGGLDSRMALPAKADEIIAKAIEVLGDKVVAELREKVQEAIVNIDPISSSVSTNHYSSSENCR